MEALKKIPVVVYAESTPNPAALKFVANKILLENSLPMEFLSPADAKISPLVTALFRFPFVKSVFISGNYITIFKTDTIAWDDITLELREFLREYLSSGKKILSSPVDPASDSPTPASEKEKNGETERMVDHTIPQSEIEQKIVDTLEQYVRPAVEQDGGIILFRSFKDGIVNLTLRGACSGCPSSTVTLKAGIEGILKKFIPEVKEVRQETDAILGG